MNPFCAWAAIIYLPPTSSLDGASEREFYFHLYTIRSIYLSMCTVCLVIIAAFATAASVFVAASLSGAFRTYTIRCNIDKIWH